LLQLALDLRNQRIPLPIHLILRFKQCTSLLVTLRFQRSDLFLRGELAGL
jgi:hypothetical protein